MAFNLYQHVTVTPRKWLLH